MWSDKYLLILGCLLHAHAALSWTCLQHIDCASTEGALCISSRCACPAAQELVLGGTKCVDRSPYYTWPCIEDHQCSALVTNFECRGSSEAQEGNCFCREGFHYQDGRCWQSTDYESPCNRDEDCMSPLRDPFSLSCDVTTRTCGCAAGYYRRQRGECRKIGYAIGDGCVLDEDCQFENGLCNINTFKCYDPNVVEAQEEIRADIDASKTLNAILTSSQNGGLLRQLIPVQDGVNASLTRQDGRSTKQHGVECDASNVCTAPFVCSGFGVCICPTGYYASNDGTTCYAELGSPSTEDQCVGLFAEVRDGICTCMANFFFEENMRDCVKVVRIISDSCVADNNCHTFGAAVRCGEPTLPWFLRTCECIPEQAVWDGERSMCRLFVGVGESCRENSDCLAGNMEIECVLTSADEGVCTCPAGTMELDGLCLTAGLELGDTCQASTECTGTANTGCYEGYCGCSNGYQETDGYCAPTIGGNCREDSDCVIDNMVCVLNEQLDGATCQCNEGYAADGNVCWPNVLDKESVCNVTAQCVSVMGEQSACADERCVCINNYHYRDGRCWPQIGLFEGCLRTSECYFEGISERVECRNSLCQCSFDYPYSEELQTCISGASTAMASLLTILAALYYIVLSH